MFSFFFNIKRMYDSVHISDIYFFFNSEIFSCEYKEVYLVI